MHCPLGLVEVLSWQGRVAEPSLLCCFSWGRGIFASCILHLPVLLPACLPLSEEVCSRRAPRSHPDSSSKVPSLCHQLLCTAQSCLAAALWVLTLQWLCSVQTTASCQRRAWARACGSILSQAPCIWQCLALGPSALLSVQPGDTLCPGHVWWLLSRQAWCSGTPTGVTQRAALVWVPAASLGGGC